MVKKYTRSNGIRPKQVIAAGSLLFSSSALVRAAGITSFAYPGSVGGFSPPSTLAARQNDNSTNTTTSTPTPLSGDVCRLWSHASMLADDKLIVDFGILTLVSSYAKGFVTITNPFTLDLSQPFKSVDIGVESKAIQETKLTEELPPKLGAGMWWGGNSTGYKYGGYFPDSWWIFPIKDYAKPRPSEVWKIDSKTLEWTKAPSSKGDPVVGSRNGGLVSVPSLGLGFSAGGYLANFTDSKLSDWTHNERQLMDRLLTYDMKDNSWKNTTAPWNPVSLSSTVFVPVGEKGILLSLGGNQIQKGQFFFNSVTPRSFQKLDIYDIASESWYTQGTSGFYPEDRVSFCVVTTAAPDKSSYNIILHGGSNSDISAASSNTYVLSLPSFTWYKTATESSTKRYGHSCHLTSNAKMIVVGGRGTDQGDPGYKSFTNGGCSKTGLLDVFDTTTLEWVDGLDLGDGGKQEVPDLVSKGIGGDKNGGATMMTPERGWDFSKLKEIFAMSITEPTSTSGSKTSNGAAASSTKAAKGGAAATSTNAGLGVYMAAAVMVGVWGLV